MLGAGPPIELVERTLRMEGVCDKPALEAVCLEETESFCRCCC